MEEFLLQLMDRCFSFVENCSAPSNAQRHELGSLRRTALSSEEQFWEPLLEDTWYKILANSSPSIVDVSSVPTSCLSVRSNDKPCLVVDLLSPCLLLDRV
jgi:hypothetical protein